MSPHVITVTYYVIVEIWEGHINGIVYESLCPAETTTEFNTKYAPKISGNREYKEGIRVVDQTIDLNY